METFIVTKVSTNYLVKIHSNDSFFIITVTAAATYF